MNSKGKWRIGRYVLQNLYHGRTEYNHNFFSHVSTDLLCLGLPIVEISRSHSETPCPLGPLWASDRPVAEAATYTTHYSLSISPSVTYNLISLIYHQLYIILVSNNVSIITSLCFQSKFIPLASESNVAQYSTVACTAWTSLCFNCQPIFARRPSQNNSTKYCKISVKVGSFACYIKLCVRGGCCWTSSETVWWIRNKWWCSRCNL